MNRDEPLPPPLSESEPDDPDMPEELALNPLAVKEWARLAPMLKRLRQITEADRGALIALCLEYSRYLDATKKVNELGLVVKAPSGYPIQNPYLGIARGALSACAKLWVELGLTPSSRSRVKTSTPEEAPDEFSVFDDDLSGQSKTTH